MLDDIPFRDVASVHKLCSDPPALRYSHELLLRLTGCVLGVVMGADPLAGQSALHQLAIGQKRDPVPPGTALGIYGPGVLAVDALGNTYVAVPDGVIRIDASGVRVRVAGRPGDWRYDGDGQEAIRAAMNPRGIAIDGAGNLYISDSGNNRIRRIDRSSGIVTTVAGNGGKGFSGEQVPARDAQLDAPTGIAIDFESNIYFADGTIDGKDRVRRVDGKTGVITTVAGNGTQGFSGDGGPAILAQLSSLGGLATDHLGNLYIADSFNSRIRMISISSGAIATVAGNGTKGFFGDGGLARDASLDNPLSVAIDRAGNLFIADSNNFRIRKVSSTTGIVSTVGDGSWDYGDANHGFPCALAVDGEGILWVADAGISGVRQIAADGPHAGSINSRTKHATQLTAQALAANPFKINVTYDSSVPASAQTAFNAVVSDYQNIFTTNVTVTINVAFGGTSLGQSLTQQQFVSYSAWRSAMLANAGSNPGNIYAAGAAASLPASDPSGSGMVLLTTANARALGFTTNVAVDSTLTFSNSVTFEYSGVATSGAADFMDAAAHELNEALGIGSSLTGLADRAPIPAGTNYTAQDYFRYGGVGQRSFTTDPSAAVYFSYDGGNTNVAQFNQSNSSSGISPLDRNDWIYGNFGCPAATAQIQNAIACIGQAVPVGTGPEVIVLKALGYNSSVPQTITFAALANVAFGVAPFTLAATSTSGLAVSFGSTTASVCTVTGNTATVVGAGSCSIVASQQGDATYSAAAPVTRSFTVAKAVQTISFGALGNATLGTAPFTVTATASSGLTVTFSSTTRGVCTVSGSSVTIVAGGACSITASQSGNSNYAAATPVAQSFTVTSTLAPTAVSPASGSGLANTFTFTFRDPAGYADLAVVDVLISTFLDGQQSCYLAVAPASGTSGFLYLVDDAGDGGYVSGTPMSLPSSGSLHNSQCTISGTGSSISGSGNILTLTLAITFTPSFAGNKVFYTAARSNTQNSGWQSIGTWNVPGTAATGPGVGTVSPGRSTSTGQNYTFTFTDTNGYADLSVLDILTNSFLDGINACYIAYAPTGPSTGYLYLVDDAGDGGYAPGSPVLLSSGSVLQNSQCAINTAASSASASGNTLTLNLSLTFKGGFAGNQVFYLAARNNSTGNSGWQAAGSVTVP